jgi:cellulose synthase/poly-beta-1,6-N-acetylglucosamine synthase-like glycosyltransferase
MAEIQSVILYFTLFVTLFFEIFLLITYFEVREELKLEEKLLNKGISRYPSVSIVVPCFNEEKTVASTVESLLSLDYPQDKLSLILVDDGSSDGTWQVLKRYGGHPGIEIYTKENGGKTSVLNFALERIQTDLVGCLDADSFVDPGALKVIVPYFEDPEIMSVIPSIKVHQPKSVLQQMQKIEYSWGVFLRRMLSSIGALYVTPGPFSIFRRQVFSDLGGYRHAHHTEDMELAMRMQKNRYRIVNSHRAHVYTVAPAKLGALVKQRVRWTYGFLNNALDYREMFFKRQYGHIGIFILPIATLSVFATLLATGNMLWRIADKVSDWILKYQTVGFRFRLPDVSSFNWYFLNTGVISFITLSVIMLTLAILFLALRMANGRAEFSKALLYYLTLYVLIVPIWLAKAVFSTVFRRNITWR